MTLSTKPLLQQERSLLEKGPKFAPTPTNIPHKTDRSCYPSPSWYFYKDAVRTSSATILHRARLPAHKNASKEERKALNDPKKDQFRVIMKLLCRHG